MPATTWSINHYPTSQSNMKKCPLLIIAVLLLSLAACKTNESNYRAAYEAAIEKQKESTALDSTIYGNYRRQASMARLAAGSDTLPLRTESVAYTENGGASRETVKVYNVVVGQFKQLFNARQMRERLQAEGYPDAMIVHTREPLYYVIAGTAGTPEEARNLFQRVSRDKALVLKSPLPFILRPNHLAH